MRKFLPFCVALLLMLTCMTSCFKEDDFKFDDIQVQVNDWGLVAPLITGEMSLENMVNLTGDSETPVTPSPDGTYYSIRYEQEVTQDLDLSSYIGPFPFSKQLHSKTSTLPYAISDTVEIGFFSNEESSLPDNISLSDVLAAVALKSNIKFNGSFTNITLQGMDKTKMLIGQPMTINPVTKDVETTGYTNIFDDVNIGPTLFNGKPQYIVFSCDLIVNNVESLISQQVTGLNLWIKGDVDLQTKGYAENLDFRSTSDFSGSDIDLDFDKYTYSATVPYSFKNGFPFDLTVQVYFADGNEKIIDSLFVGGIIIKSAPVDQYGNATGKTPKDGNVSISNVKLENLKNSSKTIIDAKFSTAGASSKKNVVIGPKNTLGVNITRLSINVAGEL